jgi:hypothetical protein
VYDISGRRPARATGQRVTGPGVVEFAYADDFPIVVGMALKTIFAQPPLVLVLMAGDAVGRHAKERLVEVFDSDDRTLGLGHAFARVTTIAGQPRVFALKHISRLLVVEALSVPLYEEKILAVMFRVAFYAFLTGPPFQVVRGV